MPSSSEELHVRRHDCVSLREEHGVASQAEVREEEGKGLGEYHGVASEAEVQEEGKGLADYHGVASEVEVQEERYHRSNLGRTSHRCDREASLRSFRRKNINWRLWIFIELEKRNSEIRILGSIPRVSKSTQ